MTVRSTLWGHRWSRALLLALCAALVPLPAMAADATPLPNPTPPVTAPAPNLKAAVAKVVERDLAAKPMVSARRSAQSAAPGVDSPSFFKSRTGILVLAAFAAGVGYAIYSTQADRIHSPGRE